MRTQKRFTPKVLDRFTREGRGTGTYTNYIPWHRVSRSDPSSRGRSHLIAWRDRQRELLSDGEWTGLNFATLLPGLIDIAEQFPLSQEDAPHDLTRWIVGMEEPTYPGTLTLARTLGVKHPSLREEDETHIWTSTTDLLLVLQAASQRPTLLAISCKPHSTLSKRGKELLLLEKTYWSVRGIHWLLITPDQYDKRVSLTLRNASAWGLAEPAREQELNAACRIVRSMPWHPYSDVIQRLANHLGGDEQTYIAQRALWQSIWHGRLPVDLRRGWRPHQPLSMLCEADFIALNPIASGRSACL